ncbi:SCO1664 family protein [Actinomarinicola tropica]|uniref:SCO1664 family protein n=2 Tax=Actinomarinicola tropica TaxID=2789776 RepID=A0A5Q2RQZ2_9ACTN|nr:SCO1664 family protein [Actinomarinicola tropica]
MPWSSNVTLLVRLHGAEGGTGRAIYKPHAGERPLWDFPDGLYLREVAAFELSRALGWDLVPATVLRRDAPHGPGSLQRFVDAEFDEHYFTLFEDEELHPQLRRICLFDLLANNTDRKGGHCLLDADRHIWAIDNGLSFHREFKLRTVIWEFGGEPIPDELLEDVRRLHDDGAPPELALLLDPFERDALAARAAAVLAEPCFPVDPTGRRYPWPLV